VVLLLFLKDGGTKKIVGELVEKRE